MTTPTAGLPPLPEMPLLRTGQKQIRDFTLDDLHKYATEYALAVMACQGDAYQWAEDVITDEEIHDLAKRCDPCVKNELRYLWLARAVLVKAAQNQRAASGGAGGSVGARKDCGEGRCGNAGCLSTPAPAMKEQVAEDARAGLRAIPCRQQTGPEEYRTRCTSDCQCAAPAVAVEAIKDGEIAKVVNALRDVAVEFHGAQQLRERIAHIVVPLFKSTTPVGVQPTPAQDAAPAAPSPAVPVEAMRAKFEAHIDDCIASEGGLKQALEVDSMGDYVTPWVQGKWQAWQAALSGVAVRPEGGRIDLTHLYRRSKVYSSIAASPHHMTFTVEALRNLIAEFTAPPAPASRVPLSEEQMEKIWCQYSGPNSHPLVITRAIEAAHGIHPASEGGEG